MEQPAVDLFGQKVDTFKNALSKYGVWPSTVWELDYQDPTARALREQIGDTPQESTRSGSFKADHMGTADCYKVPVSIFNPALAANILACFAKPGCAVFDPFAGGGTRAIVAAKRGHTYTGIELRPEEVAAVAERCRRLEVAEQVRVVQGDAREAAALLPGYKAEFLFTCPPYWNLEQYRGGSADLSTIHTYERFIAELGKVVTATRACVEYKATSAWVVGMVREVDGPLRPLHHDVTRLHEAAGFKLREEIVLHLKNNGAIQRVGQFEKGRRTLVRVHEYLLVFTAD